MRVFEVVMDTFTTEGEIQRETQFVTAAKNTLKSVSDHFSVHCHEYQKDLKSVREVLIITEHLD